LNDGEEEMEIVLRFDIGSTKIAKKNTFLKEIDAQRNTQIDVWGDVTT
jgi:hypothetical protein